MSDQPPEDFSDREAVEAWLRTQPREVSVALAARAALRSLPAHVIRASRDVNEDHALVWFAGASIAALAAHKTMLDVYLFSRIAKRSFFFAGEAATFEDAASAAASSINLDDNAHHAADAIMYSLASADSKSAFIPNDHFRSECLNAIGVDARIINSESMSAVRLMELPLWNIEISISSKKKWTSMANYLIARNTGWEVWTDWYEARLRGDPYDLALESARVLEPTEEDWKDPRRANAKIREIIERRRRETHAAMLDRIAVIESRLRALNADDVTRTPAQVADDLPGIGHNRPPAEIERPQPFLQPALNTLSGQPATPIDTTSAITAARRLRDWLAVALEWSGGKADKFFDAFATEAGKQTGGWTVRLAALGLVGSNLDIASLVANVYESVVVWLRALGVPL